MSVVQNSPIFNCPDELLINIFGRLDIPSLFHVGQTCRRFRNFCMDESLWKDVCKRELPPFVLKTRQAALLYFSGRIFAVPKSWNIVKNTRVAFPSTVRPDFSARRECGRFWKVANINGTLMRAVHHVQGKDFITFTESGHPHEVVICQNQELKTVHLSASGYLSQLFICAGKIIACTVKPFCLAIINPMTLEGQSVVGRLVDCSGSRLVINQADMSQLILLDLEKLNCLKFSLTSEVSTIAKLIPGSNALIFSSKKHLSLQQIGEKKHHHLIKLPKMSRVTDLSVGPDGRYVAILLRFFPGKNERVPNTHALVILSLREKKIKFGTHLTSPNLAYSGLFFDGKSVTIYGSNNQTHYQFIDTL